MDQQQRNIYRTVGALVLLMIIGVAGFVHRILMPNILSQQEMKSNGAIIYEKPRIFDGVSLIDQNNQPFTLERFKGKWSLVFFGYTYCPDICPTTLAMLAKFHKMLVEKNEQDNVQIVFVTVDPARDTPEKLHSYVNFFNADIVGLTGDFLEISKLATGMNAAFNKTVQPDGGYLVDHSSYIMLVNPYGHLHGFFMPPFDAGRLHMTFKSARAGFDRATADKESR